MRKKPTLIALAISALLAAGSAAIAQPPPEILHVEIPFSFVVGESMLPAGEYTISATDPVAPQEMVISGDHTDANVVFETQPIPDVVAEGQARVVFHEYKDSGEVYLAEVWIPGHSNPRQLLPSPDERAMQEAGARAERTVIDA